MIFVIIAVQLPVIAETPEDAAETIENVLKDGNYGVEVIIIDECESKCF